MRALQCFPLAALCAAGLSLALSFSCTNTTPPVPRVPDVTCSTLSIPCNDAGKTAIVCKGGALGVTGTVTYTWQCFHGGVGIAVCDYVSPAGANQQCHPFEDEYQCTAPADTATVELHCTGRAREQCSLIVEAAGQVSDPRINQGRFVITVSPACPTPDAGVTDAAATDAATDAGQSGDAF